MAYPWFTEPQEVPWPRPNPTRPSRGSDFAGPSADDRRARRTAGHRRAGRAGPGHGQAARPRCRPRTAAGAAAAALLRLEPGGPQEQDLDKLFDGFLPINRRLRDVCSAWQTRQDGMPNDHSDGAYDDTVRDRLDEVHSAIGPVLRRMAAIEPRLAATVRGCRTRSTSSTTVSRPGSRPR